MRKIGILYAALMVTTGLPLVCTLAASFAPLSPAPWGSPLEAWNTLLTQTALPSRFCRSLLLCGGITAVQLAVSALGGFAFSTFRFRWRVPLFLLLVLLMLLPVQVKLVPNYLVLRALHLLDTQWALILPTAFRPLGTVLMAVTMSRVPNELLDEARMDGAGTFRLLWSVVLPLSKPGLAATAVLSFTDAWAMAEQPMTFLHDPGAWPFSVFLASAGAPPALSAAGGVLAVLPAVVIVTVLSGANDLNHLQRSEA